MRLRHIFIIFFLIGNSLTSVQAGDALVAVATNMKFAIAEIGKVFKAETGHTVRFSFASSGNLTRQIRQGAPFELFLSANTQYIEQLKQQGLTRGKSQAIALGQLVWLSGLHSPLSPGEHLNGLKQAYADGKLQRLALANPQHAPYGVAAKEALQSLKVWKTLQPTIIYGENVAQAAHFVAVGGADAGLVSLSLALAPDLKNKTTMQILSQSLHSPLTQTAALLPAAKEVSIAFLQFLSTNKARDIFKHYGYLIPE